jgi:iron complex transport system ATP-binding protein
MSPIELRNVSLSRNNTVILQNINLAIPGGEWTSIVGPNGAGKSTLVQALAGLLPYEGSIQIGGAELRSIAIKARAQHIAWLEQATSIPDGLDFGLRVYDIAMLGRLPHQNWLSISSAVDHRAVEQAMRQTAVWDLRERFFSQLSGGERQRLVIARAIAQEAPILLLDEPTAALDIGHQQQALELVDKLRREHGLTVVSAMHDLTLAGIYSDRLILMHAGHVVAQGPAGDVLRPETLGEFYGVSVRVHREDDGTIIVVPNRTTSF